MVYHSATLGGRSLDPGWSRLTVSFKLPLKISPNRRHLVDQVGHPVLIHGDTAWSLISALTKEEVEQYLANRAEKGFNAIIVNLVEHKFNGPTNRYGEAPFRNLVDFSTTNDQYFEYADWVLQRAAFYGIVVFLAPLYLGLDNKPNDEGWFHEVRLSGMARGYYFGRYIGKRYAGFDNIIWLMGGDRNPAGVIEEEYSVVQGIKDFDTHSLFTASPELEQSTLETYGWRGWLDFNSTYTYAIVHKTLLDDYNRRPVMPFVLLSTSYENEHNASALQIRRQGYWALLCGACGQFLGNYPIWLFNPGWESALESPGAYDRVYLKAFITSRPWHQLVPDQQHRVVTGGLGESNGLDSLAAAITTDGNTVMVYLPTAQEVTIDLSRIAGSQACAWWFNPRTGDAQPAGEYSTSGLQQFSPPTEGDWGLVLDNAALKLPIPGL